MKIGTSTVTAIYLGTTSITSAYLGSTQVFGGSFTPLDLFSGGSQGIWLDPSDLSTMFSDRAGTTAVTTPGTVVGLRLDKSKAQAVGPDLVVNGDFATNLSGWTATAAWTWDAGEAKGVVASSSDTLTQTFATLAPGWVEFKYRVISGSLRCGIRNASGVYATLIANGLTGSGTFRAFTSEPFDAIQFSRSGAGTMYVDDVSVKQLPGNHAVAPTDAARPVYGVEPKGGRRNLLTYSEAFNESVWTKQGTTVTTNATTAPDGTSTAEKLIETATTAAHRAYQAITVENSTPHTTSIYAKAGERSWVSLAGTTANRAWFNLATGVVGTVSATLTASIESVGDGWYRCSVTQTTYVVSGYFDVGVASANNAYSYTGDGTSGVYIWGAQLERSATATPYQRVLSAYDITESGVPTCQYVQYDGSDDSMSTAAIDFTGTDKMSVFAGLRKLSDAARGMAVELSASSDSNVGSFGLYAPDTQFPNDNNYALQLRGSGISYGALQVFAAPISNVVAVSFDIGGSTLATEMSAKVNGAPTSLSDGGGSAGTGNFGNYPLFLGRRGGSSIPFNGRDYGLIVVGKAASAGEITDTETWLAAKTSGVSI